MTVRSMVWAGAFAGLAGCADLENQLSGGLASLAASDGTGPGIRTFALLDGKVQVRGPEGYCIDRRASDAPRGFAVLAGCALLSDQALVMPTLDGLITVQFGETGTASVAGNEAAFAAFLQSDAGRAILAGDGNLAQISEVATVTGGDAVLTRFEDASGPAFEGTTGVQWRGFQDIGGRLVTVSVMSFTRAPMGDGEGERLLSVAMEELAIANAAPDLTVP